MFHTLHHVPEAPESKVTNVEAQTLGIPTFIFIGVDEPVSEETLRAAVLSSCHRWLSPLFDPSIASTTSAASPSLRNNPPCNSALRVGRGEERYTAPSPIAIEYGTSRPVSWKTRRLSTDSTSFVVPTVETSAGENENEFNIPLRPSVLDMLAADWSPKSTYPFGADGLRRFFQNHVDKPSDKPPLHIDEEKTPIDTDNSHITLQDCLGEFAREELLGHENSWYCPRCGEHRAAKKTLEIWKVPDILVIHLKRFNNYGIVREKIDALVDFPTYGLDMLTWAGEQKLCKILKHTRSVPDTNIDSMASKDLMYDLFAVSEHEGTSLGSGHYRAYALNHEDSEWYHYADARVAPARAQDAVVGPISFLL